MTVILLHEGNVFLFFRPIIQYTLVEMMLWHGIQKHWGGQKLAPNKQANCRRQKWLKLTAVISFQLTEKVPRYPHQMFGNDYADCNANLAQRPYFQRPWLNLKSRVVISDGAGYPTSNRISVFWEVSLNNAGWTQFEQKPWSNCV